MAGTGTGKSPHHSRGWSASVSRSGVVKVRAGASPSPEPRAIRTDGQRSANKPDPQTAVEFFQRRALLTYDEVGRELKRLGLPASPRQLRRYIKASGIQPLRIGHKRVRFTWEKLALLVDWLLWSDKRRRRQHDAL